MNDAGIKKHDMLNGIDSKKGQQRNQINRRKKLGIYVMSVGDKNPKTITDRRVFGLPKEVDNLL
jgi:hypothetical protein